MAAQLDCETLDHASVIILQCLGNLNDSVRLAGVFGAVLTWIHRPEAQ